MWVRFSNIERLTDKLFYGILVILVLVLGGFGSFIIAERAATERQTLEEKVATVSGYLERALRHALHHLDAKEMRQTIEGALSEELKAVEIFDDRGERIYVYERAGGNHVVYDHTIERPLAHGGEPVGKVIAYFSTAAELRAMQLGDFLRLAILTLTLGIVLGVGLYVLVKRIILRPIDTTLLFSAELAAGNHDRRMTVTSRDEMGRLQDALNRMADSLQETVETLRASYSEAEAARQKAIEAAQLKSEFLANVSHEVRTPLNAILNFADILLDDEKDTDRRESLQTIKKSGSSLLQTINHILDLSKIEAGKLELHREKFSLEELLSEIKPVVDARLRGGKVSFLYQIDPEVSGTYVGDRTRIRQVLLNLLINATKFTENGEIILEVKPTGDGHTLLFSVKDTGIGIPPDRHELIFRPFTQVDGTLVRKHGGTGLGLAIAKNLVELMGGKIWFESALGNGTTFFFTVECSREE